MHHHDDGELIDAQALIDIFGDDRAAIDETYALFASNLETSCAEVEAAFQAHNAPELGRLAHRVKSSARTVGAYSLADALAELELASRADNWDCIESLVARISRLSSELVRYCLRD